MPDKPLSDLRRRMLADMSIRSFGDKTRHDYIRHVEALTAFLGRSPDTATGDDLRPRAAEWRCKPRSLRNGRDGPSLRPDI